MTELTDKEKAEMSKVIGKFDGYSRNPMWISSTDEHWLALGYFGPSRDPIWPVLQKLFSVDMENVGNMENFTENLHRILGGNPEDGLCDIDMMILATPAQLAVAAYKTIKEIQKNV